MKLINLEKMRKKKKWTQKETAKMIGISYSYYTKIETGDKTPTIKVIRKIIEVFGASGIDEIMQTEAS